MELLTAFGAPQDVADRYRPAGFTIIRPSHAPRFTWIALGGSYSVSKAALWSATDAMRLELAPRGVQVLGVFVGYVDTDMTTGVTAPKSDPADVVRQVLDGLETGASEVLADETSRQVRATLAARRWLTDQAEQGQTLR